MSIEPPALPDKFDWWNLRIGLDDYFFRIQQWMLQRLVGDGVQTLSGAGAILTTSLTTKWTTTGANAGTLMDGFEGQVKVIVLVVDGGDGTLTPSNLANYTTITFNDIGDSVVLQFLTGEWWVIANNGCTLA